MKGSRSISRTPGNAVLGNHFRLKVIFGKGGIARFSAVVTTGTGRPCSTAWFETPASRAPHYESPGLGAKKGYSPVIASAAKQSIYPSAETWIASLRSQ